MKAPPLLLAAATGFWGWQSNQVVISIFLALAIESARIISARYTFTQKELNRVSDLCALICMLMAAYFFIAHKSVRAIFLTVQWLPVAFAPLILTQVYNAADRINVSGFFMVVRRKYPEGRPSGPFINFSFPYLALCILGASTANISNQTFYIGFALIAACALWMARSTRFSPGVWVGALLFSVVFGYAGHIGLHNLQLLIEQKGTDWFIDSLRDDRDPFRNTTAMGDVGILKQSNRILFRVKRSPSVKLPILLRGASFTVYRNSVWFAGRAPFDLTLTPEDDGKTWVLDRGMKCGGDLEITARLKEGRGVLALPTGTAKLLNLPAAALQKNRLGTISVTGGPASANYAVCFDTGMPTDSPPDSDDLRVPEPERKALQRLISRWRLEDLPPKEAARVIKQGFATDFTYSLVLKGESAGMTPVATFLTKTKSGHCEYFATATVLLFRALGVPARYVSGYSVQESDPWGKGLVVRSRHAHAWALAYIDGKWVNMDTTSPSWPEFESNRAGFLQPIGDLWSNCQFRFSHWLYNNEGGENNILKYLIWLAITMFALMAWMIFRKKRVNPKKVLKSGPIKKQLLPGVDSPFYLVEERMNGLGFIRGRSEHLTTFLERIRRAKPVSEAYIDVLEALLSFHYRYRFDPCGMSPGEKLVFENKVRKWLKKFDDSASKTGATP